MPVEVQAKFGVLARPKNKQDALLGRLVEKAFAHSVGSVEQKMLP